MIPCLDIHTHHAAPQPSGVVAATLEDFNPIDGQFYSLGVHPWATDKMLNAEDWARFEQLAQLPCVVAIGEGGIDKLKGGPLFKQLLTFKRQIEISEKLCKPLVIHDVKSHDIIVGLKRDLKPMQNWVIHGFRAKPTVAKMMTDAGIFISFGEKYNTETLLTVPKEFILAETDDSPLSIEEILTNISHDLGEDIKGLVAANTARFLNLGNPEEGKVK